MNAVFAAALGSAPWIGGFLAGMLALRDSGGQAKVDGISGNGWRNIKSGWNNSGGN